MHEITEWCTTGTLDSCTRVCSGARVVHEHEWCTRVRSDARVVHEIIERCTRTSGARVRVVHENSARVGVVHAIAARVRVVHEMGALEYIVVHK